MGLSVQELIKLSLSLSLSESESESESESVSVTQALQADFQRKRTKQHSEFLPRSSAGITCKN